MAILYFITTCTFCQIFLAQCSVFLYNNALSSYSCTFNMYSKSVLDLGESLYANSDIVNISQMFGKCSPPIFSLNNKQLYLQYLYV